MRAYDDNGGLVPEFTEIQRMTVVKPSGISGNGLPSHIFYHWGFIHSDYSKQPGFVTIVTC